jgi:hypothetical protein
MKTLLQQFLDEENKDMPVDDTDEIPPTDDDAAPTDDYDIPDEPDEEEEERASDVADDQGFEKGHEAKMVDGKSQKLTTLLKDETLGGLELQLKYVINPKTGAWSFRIALQGQDKFVEITTGEDPLSLIKHLKKKHKVTAHQAVENLPEPDKVDDDETI